MNIRQQTATILKRRLRTLSQVESNRSVETTRATGLLTTTPPLSYALRAEAWFQVD